ncbi:hypothetical protein SA496_07455 [Pseudomonas sp. JS3066]|uniref:hypothetical protein n=1 Tax=Pseudomonas sp. JS3066 TaxID=3090665 RepID=UPI002E7C3A5B|nr:hypothetical protein [Pseudomonas sp. JS3066]WVK95005.1 hypothetical protein SA496_07455 [Pseudomonas sp. JS3066]
MLQLEVNAVRGLSLGLRSDGLLAIALLSVIAKTCVDYFLFAVSPVFGIYGVEVKGSFFSDIYWLSWVSYIFVMPAYFLFISGRGDIFDFALSFLFFSIFLPLLSLFWIEQGDLSYLSFCSIFWFLLFLALALLPVTRTVVRNDNVASRVEGFLDWFFLAVVVLLGGSLLLNFSIFSGFGFDSVYERRKAFTAWLGGGLSSYLYAWSVYVFGVYLVFVSRRKLFKLVGLLYVLIFYAVAGDKVYLFLLALVFFLRMTPLLGGASLLLCGFIFLSLSGVGFFYLLGDIWVPTIVQRFLALPVDISFNYVEYFKSEPLLYAYSFLSSLFDYSYSDLPAKLIGAEYYVVGDNATVNFLADAYVNLGWVAIAPLLFFFVSLRAILRSSKYLVLIVPVFTQALDTPLPTLLLTGGGGLMIIICYMLSKHSLRQARGAGCQALSSCA